MIRGIPKWDDICDTFDSFTDGHGQPIEKIVEIGREPITVKKSIW